MHISFLLVPINFILADSVQNEVMMFESILFLICVRSFGRPGQGPGSRLGRGTADEAQPRTWRDVDNRGGGGGSVCGGLDKPWCQCYVAVSLNCHVGG